MRKYESSPGELLFPDVKLRGNKTGRLSTSRFNYHVKNLGKMAGLTYSVDYIDYSGQESVPGEKTKYDVMSSHIARKTFVTFGKNLGLPLEEVAAITDHDSRAIEVYYKINQETQSRAMSKMNSFKFSTKEAQE